MREILFKAKRLYDGEWVEGFYVKAELLDGSGSEHVIIEYSRHGTTHIIDPTTICQYTGRTDKNGKKIFEGDIIKHYNNCPIQECSIDTGKIFWYQPTQRYLRTSSMFPDDCPELFEWNEYEVIGNIHDKEADHERL